MSGINTPTLDELVATISPCFARDLVTRVVTDVPAAAARLRLASFSREQEDFYMTALDYLFWHLSLLPPSLALVFAAFLFYAAAVAAEQGGGDLTDSCGYITN